MSKKKHKKPAVCSEFRKQDIVTVKYEVAEVLPDGRLLTIEGEILNPARAAWHGNRDGKGPGNCCGRKVHPC